MKKSLLICFSLTIFLFAGGDFGYLQYLENEISFIDKMEKKIEHQISQNRTSQSPINRHLLSKKNNLVNEKDSLQSTVDSLLDILIYKFIIQNKLTIYVPADDSVLQYLSNSIKNKLYKENAEGIVIYKRKQNFFNRNMSLQNIFEIIISDKSDYNNAVILQKYLKRE